MPLRDHFRAPVKRSASWEGLHAVWPTMILLQLNRILPPGFLAEPRVHLGRNYELDIGAFESDELESILTSRPDIGPDAAMATLDAPVATTTAVVDFNDQYQYEVQIYNEDQARSLVAAIELASPGNQDRPERREAFVEKCAALLQEGICVSIVDLVTDKHFNLHAELLERFNLDERAFGEDVPSTYAATSRRVNVANRSRLDTWAYTLKVGQRLPELPIWLSEMRMISLDLEASYEDACRALRIT